MSEEVSGNKSQEKTEDLFYEPEATKTEEVNESDKGTIETQEEPSTEKTEEGSVEAEEGDKTEEAKVEFEVKDLKLSEDKVLQDKEVSEFVTEAKKLGLNKEQTQALLTAKEQERVNGQAELNGQLEKLKADWLEKSKNDPDIGGDNLKIHAEHARRAIDKYGSPELKDALNKTGYGNHPEIIKVFSKIGQEIADGTFVKGNAVAKPTSKSPAEVFYGSSESK